MRAHPGFGLGWLGLAGLGLVLANRPSAPSNTLVCSRYSTSLVGRTPGQVHNAIKSARSLHGVSIRPGETFSFNRKVGSWSRDQGYRKAPVSYDGQLVLAWGGGVCQTSTTLYNAALLAGLQVVERRRHQFAPGYVPPGRDAAVAFGALDLRLKNPYDFPILIETKATNQRLQIRLLSRTPLPQHYQVTTEVTQTTPPAEFIVRPTNPNPHPTTRIRNSGKPGFEVRVWRTSGGTRELISQDTYPPMHRIVERTD